MFQQDNGFIYFINKVVDIIFLSLLWMACCLPLITIGAATAALYRSVAVSIWGDKGYAVRSFFSTFRSSFRQSLPVTLLSLLFTALFCGGIYFCYVNPMGLFTDFYLVFSVICLLVTLLVQIHAYALIGRFRLDNRELLSVVVRMTGRNLLRNLLLLGIVAAALVAVLLLPILAFGAPAFAMLLVSLLEEPVFKKHIRFTE